jgi:hypothetical protein
MVDRYIYFWHGSCRWRDLIGGHKRPSSAAPVGSMVGVWLTHAYGKMRSWRASYTSRVGRSRSSIWRPGTFLTSRSLTNWDYHSPRFGRSGSGFSGPMAFTVELVLSACGFEGGDHDDTCT